LAHQNLACRINAVNLKDALRQVQPDRGNLLHGRLLEMGCCDQRPHLGTMMPQRGPSTPSLQPISGALSSTAAEGGEASVRICAVNPSMEAFPNQRPSLLGPGPAMTAAGPVSRRILPRRAK